VNLRRLKRLLARACRLEGQGGAEVAVLLGDDSRLEELNRRFRRVASPTDVLAFPWQGSGEWPAPGTRKRLLGEIAISTETAARQARERGHSLEREVSLLAIHGLLHLRGWRDDSAAGRRRMAARLEELTEKLWSRGG
jgi:probable rRNA maturation factor